MTALMAITAGVPYNKAFLAGLGWGIGHSTGLLLVAAIFLGLGHAAVVDLDEIGGYCEWIVGFLMIILGFYTMWEAFKRPVIEDQSVQSTDKEGQGSSISKAADVHLTISSQQEAIMLAEVATPPLSSPFVKDPEIGNHADAAVALHKKDAAPVTWWSHWKERLLSFTMGTVHGIAGPGGILGVLPAVQLRDGSKASLYLFVFCFTSILVMGCFAAFYGGLTQRLGITITQLAFYLRILSSFLSIAVGILWITLSALGIMEEVFH